MKISLRQLRRMREKSQEDLAEMLHIHVQTYRKIERNPNLATIEQAKKIAGFLDFPYDDIFFCPKALL